MIERYKRWRHTRGFGIHSPFAYGVVRDIVSQPYHYYGYADIDAGLEHIRRPRRVRDLCRFLLRLNNFLHPGNIYLPSEPIPQIISALRLGYPDFSLIRSDYLPENGDFILDTGGISETALVKAAFRQDVISGMILNVPDIVREYVIENIGQGVVLYSGRHLLFFRRPNITPVAYSVNFF